MNLKILLYEIIVAEFKILHGEVLYGKYGKGNFVD